MEKLVGSFFLGRAVAILPLSDGILAHDVGGPRRGQLLRAHFLLVVDDATSSPVFVLLCHPAHLVLLQTLRRLFLHHGRQGLLFNDSGGESDDRLDSAVSSILS